jgi:two-component system, OmpR family, sensor histidine kinase MtrB
MSLRRIVATAVVVITSMALASAIALVRVATYLHGTATALADSVEGVRLAQESQIDLLLYQRASDPVLRGNIDLELRRNLAGARAYVSGDVEAQILDAAERAVVSYLTTGRGNGDHAELVTVKTAETRLTGAYTALEALVAINLEQAHAAQTQATGWDRASMTFGVAVSVFLVAAVAAMLWWLRTATFSPLLSLARAMERFGGGDRQVRAVGRGPQELRDMADRFNDMADKIAQRREEQIAFVGAVAHDLRSPLSVLASAASELSLEGLSPAELQHLLSLVARQVTRMDRMLGDLVDSARIEAGTFELRLEHRDLRGLVREAVELYSSSASSRRLEVRLPEAEIVAVCDPTRVSQVLSNLLSNALKYSPPRSAVVVSLTVESRFARLEVTDSGVGIAAKDIGQLFEPFRRVGTSRTMAAGAGLGLFVARQVAESHGGRIEVDSAPGAGSTFRVLLPLAGPNPTPTTAAQAPTSAVVH